MAASDDAFSVALGHEPLHDLHLTGLGGGLLPSDAVDAREACPLTVKRTMRIHGKRFWTTSAEVGMTPDVLVSEDFRRVLTFGLGLTDAAKKTSGADSSLRPEDFDVPGLLLKIQRYAPCVVAFNGKKAASVILGRPRPAVRYGLQQDPFGPSRAFVLPSTSGAARGHWDIRPWRALTKLAVGGDL